jgi:hypothetical protein
MVGLLVGAPCRAGILFRTISVILPHTRYAPPDLGCRWSVLRDLTTVVSRCSGRPLAWVVSHFSR